MNKKHRRKKVVFIGLIVIIFFIYFLIKQPLFFNYPFSISLLDRIPSANQETLKNHTKFLSENSRTSKIGQEKIVRYILNELKRNQIDGKNIEIQEYDVEDRKYKNIIVHFGEQAGDRSYIPKYVIGAHYDAFGGLPGADDNASASAGLLEISRVLNKMELFEGRNIDLVFYSTEEPPFYGTENMGSYKHAESILGEKNIKLVVVLEMIGYFSEEENSQDFPVSFLKYFYPTKGNFVAVVSNFPNFIKTRSVKSRFNTFLKKNDLISVESLNAPASVPGVDFSDHRNYWKFNIPAVMITDTAFYRNKNYHTMSDTYEKLDYERMKEVVDATVATVLSL